MDKRLVRSEIREKIKKLNQREIHKFTREINSHIVNSRLFLEGKVIMAYLGEPGEVIIDQAIQVALNQGKTVCVPQILEGEGQMQAVKVTSLKKTGRDRFGIRTPLEPVEIVAPEDIDVVLTPGLGFTADGCRLGKGKGYYDRYLPRCTKAVSMAIGYEVQVVKELPVETYDAKMRYLCTETGLRVCK